MESRRIGSSEAGVVAAIVGSRSGRHMAENAGGAEVPLEDSLVELEELLPLGPNAAP